MDPGEPAAEQSEPPAPGDVPALAPAVRVWPSFVTLVIALIGILGGGCLVGSFYLPSGGARLDAASLMAQPGFLIGSAALSQLSLLLAVWKLPGLFGDVGAAGWRERVAWRPARLNLVDVLVTALGTQAIGAVALSVLALFEVKAGVLGSMGDVSRSTDSTGFALLLLFGALAPGFAEELSFRGLLQTRLIERWGPGTGLVVSALMFGAWHFDLRQGLMAFAMGLWLGWCAHRQKSVVNVALAHAFNNGFAFVMTRLSTEPESRNSAALVAVTVVVWALCARVMWQRTRDA